MEIISILVIGGLFLWMVVKKMGDTTYRGNEPTYTRDEVASVSTLMLRGTELRHNQSWKKDQHQAVLVSFHQEGEAFAATRFGEVANDRFLKGGSIPITPTTRFEVKSRVFENMERKWRSNGKSGSFDFNKDNINGAHLIAVSDTGHITSLVCYPFPNGDERGANDLADLRITLDKMFGDLGSQNRTSLAALPNPNPSTDGFDL